MFPATSAARRPRQRYPFLEIQTGKARVYSKDSGGALHARSHRSRAYSEANLRRTVRGIRDGAVWSGGYRSFGCHVRGYAPSSEFSGCAAADDETTLQLEGAAAEWSGNEESSAAPTLLSGTDLAAPTEAG
ncbi:hypothetical protein HPB50_016548 [Hyalomma asiaticum]|uniref:Uncharacterized protein n=1 Tax=Hyalomma asiaticum TaxID=266040 RepID=A0ACB7SZM6_HYAAI|nr:hypothetical protein HPB50_016548 [Hyalomma asiaticum]